jgi:general stress protein 26
VHDPGPYQRAWEIIEKVGVCMFTTRFEGGLRARPLEARPDRKTDRLLFVTDARSAKREELQRWPDVGLVFMDAAGKAYLSITGRARVVEDDELRAVAWRASDAVWWPQGPRDPNVCVLAVEPSAAELWDGPASAAVVGFEFAKARVTATQPDVGENRRVEFDLKR